MEYRIIGRSSPLSQIQVKEFADQFNNTQFAFDWFDTPGDRDKNTSLTSMIPGDFFTRDLDQAILNNTADIAVHSAKDLAWPLPKGLIVGALLPPAHRGDSLYTRSGLTLNELPKASVIGTSSENRKQQILAKRPDLRTRDIRGTIEERIAQCDAGIYDGVIIATCALDRLGLGHKRVDDLDFETHPLQGYLAAVIRNDNLQARQLLWNVDIRRKYGTVYLVGAGPAGPEYCCSKTLEIIKNADVIFYDDLVSPEFVDLNTGAKAVYVGKRKGGHYSDQKEINNAMYTQAISGNTVVRLKGGDPLIFGRAGEESDYLRSRLVHAVIVPAISSSQLAAAEAGLSLTYRGKSPRFIAQSGHTALSLQKGRDTQAFYMGASKQNDLKSELLSHGANNDSTVVLVESAGGPDQRIHHALLQDLPLEDVHSPVMILHGGSIDFKGSHLRYWYTGLTPYRLGFPYGVYHNPLIQTKPLFTEPLPSEFDALIFTSRQGVEYFVRRFGAPRAIPIISIGDATSYELQKHGLQVFARSELAYADSVCDLLDELEFKSYLYPVSNLSSNNISNRKDVISFPFYTSEYRRVSGVDPKHFDGIIFTSPSTVESYFDQFNSIPGQTHVIAMGSVTKGLLESKGVQNVQTIQA